uniref:Uncharacterized protein n=1 Tax=viral metagenome TaxID=1070528 RepID=A0A6M3KMZ6_9ZZZZ
MQWEWFDDINTFKVFIYLLLDCNFQPTKWKGVELDIGETIKGLEKIAKETNLSLQNIRTAVKHLKSTGELTERQHGKYRILKVNNYTKYQLDNKETNTLLTRNQQESNKKVTAYKEVKKERTKELKKDIYTDKKFNNFYEQYPNKKGKLVAYRKFISLSEEEKDKCIEVLKFHVNSDQWQRDGGRFIPYPATWLNQGRWDDEIKDLQEYPEYGDKFQELSQANKKIMIRRIEKSTETLGEMPSQKQIDHWIKTEL